MSNQPSNAGKKNAGYIIENDRANDRQPHYRGKVSVEGKEYLVSVWKKDPRDGKEMMSLELTDPATLPARPGQPGPAGPRPPAPRADTPAASAAPARTASPAAPAPKPPGEDKAFDDIFGGDGNQW